MNAVFTAIFICSAAILAIVAPQDFLSSLIGGARTAAKVSLTLFCIYAVWMGLAAVAEDCGLTKNTAALLKPLCRKAFKTKSESACEAAAMNLTCDLLGAGASTPFAVKAIGEWEKENNGYAQKLLFIINAAGFQLIPSTVITLRASYGSVAAADIFLPSLICSAATLIISVGLFIVTERLTARKKGRKGAGRRTAKARKTAQKRTA